MVYSTPKLIIAATALCAASSSLAAPVKTNNLPSLLSPGTKPLRTTIGIPVHPHTHKPKTKLNLTPAIARREVLKKKGTALPRLEIPKPINHYPINTHSRKTPVSSRNLEEREPEPIVLVNSLTTMLTGKKPKTKIGSIARDVESAELDAREPEPEPVVLNTHNLLSGPTRPHTMGTPKHKFPVSTLKIARDLPAAHVHHAHNGNAHRVRPAFRRDLDEFELEVREPVVEGKPGHLKFVSKIPVTSPSQQHKKLPVGPRSLSLDELD